MSDSIPPPAPASDADRPRPDQQDRTDHRVGHPAVAAEAHAPAEFVTALRRRGYAVLPTPRKVELRGGSVRLDGSWRVTHDVPADDIAVTTLRSHLDAEGDGASNGAEWSGRAVHLAVRPGAVVTGREPEVAEQAYRLTASPRRIEIIGNGRPGLFYGVQTLLQLLDGDGQRCGVLPVGTIEDWPEYQLRIIHWDTKHHQDRLETLRRYLDACARYKINAVCFELEDKFAYPSHPVIGAPGAFTPEQLQALVDYGLARHIQIIPNVQAPAHLTYVLKHEEFAPLRCDGSNYQICMDAPEARRLIFDLYDDLCQATRGVDYFHVSTDEVYYAGICETYRQPYNPQNRSRTWVDFVNAAHEFLSQRGRRVMLWLEYPLLPEHVELLPADLINGILTPQTEEAFVAAQNARGIRQLLYCPIQGAEKLFPSYFGQGYHAGGRPVSRLADTVRSTGPGAAARGNPIGTFAAAWGDAGLHNETFWLGWAMMAQGGWSPGAAGIEQTVAEFMDLHYGREVVGMADIYHGLQTAARFWERSWDREPSKVRKPLYGSSRGKRPIVPSDLTLLAPALPGLPDLRYQPVLTSRYEAMLDEASRQLEAMDLLLARLHANVPRARRNRYGLEVFIGLACFMRHHLQMVLGLAAAERTLASASEAHADDDPNRAIRLMRRAHADVGRIVEALYAVYQRTVRVWERSRYPRNAPVEGREFVHVFDDVKDHFADRRADLSYLIAPAESIGLPEWRESLMGIVHAYAAVHNVPVSALEDQPIDD